MGLPISSLTFSSTVVNGQAEAAGLSSRDTTKGADGKGHGAMGGAGTSSQWCRGHQRAVSRVHADQAESAVYGCALGSTETNWTQG